MSAAALSEPAPPRQPTLFLRAGAVFLRALLGLFILGQAAFLVLANVLDMESVTRDYLTRSRAENGSAWTLIEHSEPAEQAVAEWLKPSGDKKRSETTIGAIYEAVGKPVQWWARTARQEQGWSLFAPDTLDWCCFPSVELRWDRAPEGTRPPVVLPSANEPPDKHRFFRLGRFRLRRFEMLLDVEPMRDRNLTPEQADTLGDLMKELVRKKDDYILAYLRWRWRLYREEHPGVPAPTQIILHTRGWIIPAPPGEKPWDWQFVGDYPVARWQPGKELGDEYYPLEVYVPRFRHFTKLEK